ncbi:MAG: glycosyltransferase family protein [Promethearchaeota archaeon]
MRLLYGINTNGQGHINRARDVIRQLLLDGHQVDCLFSGPTPPLYAKSLSRRWRHIPGYKIKFSGHGINVPETLLQNLLHFRNFPRIFENVRRLVKLEDYDAVITDFEGFSCMAGLATQKPVISVDHQHSLIHFKQVLPPVQVHDLIVGMGLVLYCTPLCHHYFAIDFVQELQRSGIGTLFPLFEKSELLDYTPTVEDHYCVYLPYLREQHLLKVLKTFPEEQFRVYGYNRKETHCNISFEPTGRQSFLKDMASSKGVLMHAGFSSSWEAILLKKHIYLNPLDNHIEQATNAHRLAKIDRAHVAPILTHESVAAFLSKAQDQDYQVNANLTITHPSVLTNAIYDRIDDFEPFVSWAIVRKQLNRIAGGISNGMGGVRAQASQAVNHIAQRVNSRFLNRIKSPPELLSKLT